MSDERPAQHGSDVRGLREVWLLWDCGDLIDVYATKDVAEEALAKRLGPNPDRLTRGSMTVRSVVVRDVARSARPGLSE